MLNGSADTSLELRTVTKHEEGLQPDKHGRKEQGLD